MELPWELVKRRLTPGAIILDRAYRFSDRETKPKYLLILTDIIDYKDDEVYMYCLTTSQTGTYAGSYSTHIKASDEALGDNIIIELELIHPIRVSTLKAKHENGSMKYLGHVNNPLLDEVFEEIEDSSRIPDFIKKSLGL